MSSRHWQSRRAHLHRHQHHFRSRNSPGNQCALVGASGNLCCFVVGRARAVGRQLDARRLRRDPTADKTDVQKRGAAMDVKSHALIALGETLRSRGYRFVTVTPATHCRVLEKPLATPSLESIFGWNRPFDRWDIDNGIFELLEDAEALEGESGRYRSKVRFASIDELLFVHSGFPTDEQDAVFFGPDTYRFVRLLRTSLTGLAASKTMTLIDVGSGSGAGGIFAARLLGKARQAGSRRHKPQSAGIQRSSTPLLTILPSQRPCTAMFLAGIDGDADIIIANPPYLVDDDRRLYRHGGGELGIDLAVRIAEESLPRLRPGGQAGPLYGYPHCSRCRPPHSNLCSAACNSMPATSFMRKSIPTSSARNSTGPLTRMPIESPPSVSPP